MRMAGYGVILLAAAGAWAQDRNQRIRLIVQGDDMGVARSVNEGTIHAYRQGVMRSTNVIVPGSWFLDAVRMLEANPDLDVGVHLTLTSEWDRVKWRPLTAGRSFTDPNGYFFPFVFPSKLGPALKEASFRVEEIETELRAQIETARKHLPRVSYLSSHMGCTNVSDEVKAVLAKLSKEYRLPVPGTPGDGIERLRGVWTRDMNAEQRGAAFAAKLESLTPGTWLFVEHAAFDTPESRGMGHPTYEDVARDRQAVTDAWCDARVKAVVKKRGIDLIGHRDWQKK